MASAKNPPQRHQLGAGVAAVAVEPDTQRGRRRDCRHKAELDALRLQHRPLLDVELDKERDGAAPHASPLQNVLPHGFGDFQILMQWCQDAVVPTSMRGCASPFYGK